MIRRFLSDTSGAMSVEYALVATLISLIGLKSVHCVTVYCLAPTFSDIAAFFQSTSV